MAEAAVKKVAFGPEVDFPSWNWVGFDTARELSKYYDISVFTVTDPPPPCDVLFIVKYLPQEHFIRKAKAGNSKIIYCPIDYFPSLSHLHKYGPILREFDLVLSHCGRLSPHLKQYCSRVHYVDHHSKYALGEMAPYRDKGYVLWVGGCQHLPYLLRWCEHNPIGSEIKILTNIWDERAVQEANRLAHEFGLTMKLDARSVSVNGCEIRRWSERLQYDMMSECKAAIDIKGHDDFQQSCKPATKAQKYVASGIPFAVNQESYSYEAFQQQGFDVALPTMTERWFSREYWEETRKFGAKLREATSLQTVGLKYKHLIETL